MADAKINAQIIVTAQGTDKIKKVGNDLDGLEKRSAKTAGAFEKFSGGLRNVTEGLAAFAPAAAVFKATFDLALEGAQIERTAGTFELLTSQIGTTTAILDDLRRVTGNTVTDLSLIQSANNVIAFGFAETEEEVTKLISTATKLGSVFSDSADPVADFTNLLKNQSIEVLDNFGISSGRVRERIAELTTGVNALDRETAFITATMEEAEKAITKLGLEGDITGDAFTRMSIRAGNFTNSLKVQIASGLEPWAKLVLGDYKRAIDTIIDGNLEMAKATGDFTDFSVVGFRSNVKLNSAAIEASETFEEYAENIDEARRGWRLYNREAFEAFKTTQNFNEALELSDQKLIQQGRNIAQANIARREANRLINTSNDVVLSEIEILRRLDAEKRLQIRNSRTVAEEQLRIEQQNAMERFAIFEQERVQRIELRQSIEAFNQARQQSFTQAFGAELQAEEATTNFTNALLQQAIASGASAENIAVLAVLTGDYSDEQITNALKVAAINQEIERLAEALAAGDINALEARDALNEFKDSLDGLEGTPTNIAGQIDSLTGSANNAETSIRNTSLALDALNGKTTTASVILNGIFNVPSNFQDATQATPLANGGDFSAGERLLVGERGPEIVTFGSSGTVTPNSQITNAPNITIHVNSPMMATPKAIAGAVAQQLGQTMRG